MLGIGLIVKNERENLPLCLDSVKDIADIICVIDTGSVDETEEVVRKWAMDHQKTLLFRRYLGASEQNNYGDWFLTDWALARNQYTEDLDDKVDFILSMDADDRVQNQDELKKALTLDYDVFGIWNSFSRIKYIQHRLWRTKKSYRFKYPIFEYLDFPVAKVIDTDVLIKTAAPGPKSTARNLRILEQECKRNPCNRMLFYYGNSLKESGRFEEAIVTYRRYVANPVTFWDEYIRARIYLMRCLRAAGKKAEAYKEGFLLLSEDQRFSEISMELAYMYVDDKNWDKAASMCYFSLQEMPQTRLFLETDKYKSEPERCLKLCIKNLSTKEKSTG